MSAMSTLAKSVYVNYDIWKKAKYLNKKSVKLYLLVRQSDTVKTNMTHVDCAILIIMVSSFHTSPSVKTNRYSRDVVKMKLS